MANKCSRIPLGTTDPQRRYLVLRGHLLGDHCRTSPAAAEAVREVLAALLLEMTDPELDRVLGRAA